MIIVPLQGQLAIVEDDIVIRSFVPFVGNLRPGITQVHFIIRLVIINRCRCEGWRGAGRSYIPVEREVTSEGKEISLLQIIYHYNDSQN